MSAPMFLGRPLRPLRPVRLVPRNISNAPEHGLRLRGVAPRLLSTQVPKSDSPQARTRTKQTREGHYWTAPKHDRGEKAVHWLRRVSAVQHHKFTINQSWLREACTCDTCVDPSSGQKRFASCDIPSDVLIEKIEVTEDDALEVHFKDDRLTGGTHISRYPKAFWERYYGAQMRAGSTQPVPKPKAWDRKTLEEKSPYFGYSEFMGGGPEYRQAMTTLSEFGVIFLRDVPSSEESVQEIAGKIGIIQDTFYGRTWDVRSKPNAENVAYTNSFLGLHQDLLYIRNVPRIQLLHCIENTCEGGESLFSDGIHIANYIRQGHPNHAVLLRKRKVDYHYDKNGNTYHQRRAVLPDLSEDANTWGITWSPPFESPIQTVRMGVDDMNALDRWRSAANYLKHQINARRNVYTYKMRPSECVIFDNRRLLHGRRAFDTSTGARWLKGTYVENDSYESTLRSLKLVEPSDPPASLEQPQPLSSTKPSMRINYDGLRAYGL
ncbi:Clavaminate synthase-like protein [Xylaria palmicola]|nr:Clavaminate synthase-like protein [Xylaria palmicola]